MFGIGLTVNEWAKKIGNWAIEKGWRDDPKTALEVHMLCISEIVEATEAVRMKKLPLYYEGDKPEGEMIELADCVVRIMDYFEFKGWDLEDALVRKMQYNQTRPYRHGNKAK